MTLFQKEIKIGRLYIWLLITYFLFSPIYFGIVYPIKISGDGGLIYFIPLSICFITLFISLPVLLVVKYIAAKKLLLGYVFLFFFILSSLLGSYIGIEGESMIALQTILTSNGVGLFITFSCVWLFGKT